MRRILLALAPMLLVSAAAFAQSEPGAAGWAPALLIRGIPSYPEGMRATVSSDRYLKKTDQGSIQMWTSRGLCGLGVGDGDLMQVNGPPANVWRANWEYLGEQGGRHQVKITSGFTRLGSRDTSAMTTQTVSLREGDAVVLDALSGPLEDRCEVHAITFEARLIMKPANRSLAATRYVADMWLVHTDPSGQERRQHLLLTADGRNPVPFAFERVGFPLPQVDPRQGNAEVVIRLTGAVRLRPRLDGQVDIDLETDSLLFNVERPENPVHDMPFGTARKTLTMKEDETTAIEFPAKGIANMALIDGRSGSSAGGGGGTGGVGIRVGPGFSVESAAAVEVRGNRLNVNLAPFFKDHRTQLLVTLKRAR